MPEKAKRSVLPSVDVMDEYPRIKRCAQVDPRARGVAKGSRIAFFRREGLRTRCEEVEALEGNE